MAPEAPQVKLAPGLEVFEDYLINLPNPQGSECNKKHFILSSGKVIVKCVPWMNSETGEVIHEEPQWILAFRNVPLIEKADFMENLPDADPAAFIGKGLSQLLKNPLTGEIKPKIVPWFDSESRAYILSEYVPDLVVSPGKKIRYKHNPEQEFDDPNDENNLRFFRDQIHRVSAAYTELCSIAYADGKPHTIREDHIKERVIVGANLGGTIMMESSPEGLVAKVEIANTFNRSYQKKFPKTKVTSFPFASTKPTIDSPASYGIDSSQMEMDFISDLAITMVRIWNFLPEEDRKAFTGFMVTIGSDTAVAAISYLKMILGPECPFSVIAVAAMKPLDEESSEGSNNFLKALEHLHTLQDLNRSVIALRVEGGLYDPSKTIKVKDDVAGAFEGAKYIDTDKLQKVDTAQKQFRERKDEDFTQEYKGALILRGSSRVKSVHSEISIDPFELETEIKASSAKAILVETYPSFTQASNIQQAIIRGAQGRPVFYINSVPGGSVDHDYEVARTLVKQGVQPLQLTEHAARVKLNYAIQLFGDDTQKIIDFMTKNDFVGEQHEDFSPFTKEANESVDHLKQKLYEAFGITGEMIRVFESNEFQSSYTISQITRQMRAQTDQVMPDTIPSPTTYLYPLYSHIKQWCTEDMVLAIQNNEGGIQDLLRTVDATLTDNVIAGSISTVRTRGMPIELEEIEEE